MKWTNKGHEFDELGAVFQKNDTLVLIGKQSDNDMLRKKLDFLGVKMEIIDTNSVPALKIRSNKNRFINFFHRIFNKIKRIKRQMEINKFYKQCSLFEQTGKTIVFSGGDSGIEYFERTGKYRRNVNIFDERMFMDKYLSIFAVYVCDKVYSVHNGFGITTVCNLNCKFCITFSPYNKVQRHRKLDELKSNIDIYFSCFDRVGLLSVSGGEPLLHPHLDKLLDYIIQNHRNKIDVIGIPTNCTIIPSDDLCKIASIGKIKFFCDDYTKSLPNIKPNFVKFIDKLKEYGIEYQINKIEHFMKAFPPIRPNEYCGNSNDEAILIEKFNKCKEFFNAQELGNGCIFSCGYQCFAATAGILESPGEYYDLTDFNIQNKKELVEFRLGYNSKGYVDFCKYCNGLSTINNRMDNGAEQAKGRLTWDINNPTYLEDLED